MEPRNRNQAEQQKQQGQHTHPLPQEMSGEQRELNEAAHIEAEKDIEEDTELSAQSPNDDLDEGESARLGEDVSGYHLKTYVTNKSFIMQQFNGRPATRERREEDNRRQFVSSEEHGNSQDRRLGGEPAKFNTRSEQRRISWENDLYERQSI